MPVMSTRQQDGFDGGTAGSKQLFWNGTQPNVSTNRVALPVKRLRETFMTAMFVSARKPFGMVPVRLLLFNAKPLQSRS